eukprot:162398_1
MNSTFFNPTNNHSQSLPLSFSAHQPSSGINQSQNKLQHQHSYCLLDSQIGHSKANHVVLLDWDDTLFPTTALFDQSYNNKSIDLQKLSQSVFTLLTSYSTIYGSQNIFIVTNGVGNWVLKSLQVACGLCDIRNIKHSFQSIYDWISTHDIKMISARAAYATKYPKQSMIWKYLVFKQIIDQQTPSIVVCIGDSSDEYRASQLAVSNSPKKIALHRLKVKAKPSIPEMNQQFELMQSLGSVWSQMTKNITIDYAAAKAEFLQRNTK